MVNSGTRTRDYWKAKRANQDSQPSLGEEESDNEAQHSRTVPSQAQRLRYLGTGMARSGSPQIASWPDPDVLPQYYGVCNPITTVQPLGRRLFSVFALELECLHWNPHPLSLSGFPSVLPYRAADHRFVLCLYYVIVTVGIILTC
jgi:hypothetical protein